MKKNKIIIIPTLAILIIIFCITIYNIKNPVIKGLYGNMEIIKYNGKTAEMHSFFSDSTEAEYLGRTEDKNFEVYAYKNGSNYNLFTLFGSDNTNTYKVPNFSIPKDGEVTKVFFDPNTREINNKVIKNQSDIEMFKKLVSYKNSEDVYHINNIYTEGTEIYFAYDNCPVATSDNLVGYIAYIDHNWILVSPENYYGSSNNTLYSNEADLIGSKITDSKLIKWLNDNETEVAPPSYKEKL
ncbi:hypothetical protein P6O23_07755 [Clostridium perfringens]|nr:hypothetical protein [Clostridium perfringens]